MTSEFISREMLCSPYENVTSLPGENLDLAFGRTKEQGNKAKLWDFRPLAVKVVAYYITSAFNLAQR